MSLGWQTPGVDTPTEVGVKLLNLATDLFEMSTSSLLRWTSVLATYNVVYNWFARCRSASSQLINYSCFKSDQLWMSQRIHLSDPYAVSQWQLKNTWAFVYTGALWCTDALQIKHGYYSYYGDTLESSSLDLPRPAGSLSKNNQLRRQNYTCEKTCWLPKPLALPKGVRKLNSQFDDFYPKDVLRTFSVAARIT